MIAKQLVNDETCNQHAIESETEIWLADGVWYTRSIEHTAVLSADAWHCAHMSRTLFSPALVVYKHCRSARQSKGRTQVPFSFRYS